MRASPFETGELIAESGFEQPAPERRKDFRNRDILRRPGQCITSGLAANTLHKLTSPEDTHQFGDIRDGQRFSVPDLGNRQALAFPGSRNAEKTP